MQLRLPNADTHYGANIHTRSGPAAPVSRYTGRAAEWAPMFFCDDPVRGPYSTSTIPPPAKLANENAQVYVVVNHGAWIVECPDCHTAQLASHSDHRFLCHCCGNLGVSGLWRPVVWPLDPEGIEKVLVHRAPPNRNWYPPETVHDLAMENYANMRGRL